jgi:hypothetical protein
MTQPLPEGFNPQYVNQDDDVDTHTAAPVSHAGLPTGFNPDHVNSDEEFTDRFVPTPQTKPPIPIDVPVNTKDATAASSAGGILMGGVPMPPPKETTTLRKYVVSKELNNQGNLPEGTYVNDPREDAVNQTRKYLDTSDGKVTPVEAQGQRNFFGPTEDLLQSPDLTAKEKYLRGSMSYNDLDSDKEAKFKQFFPDGEFKQVYAPYDDPAKSDLPDPSKAAVIFRTAPDQPWARFSLDSGEKLSLLGKFLSTNATAIATGDPDAFKESRKLAADVALQIFEDNQSMLPILVASGVAGGAAGTLAQSYKLGAIMSTIVEALGFGAGGGGAKLAEEIAQQAQGYNSRSGLESAGAAGKEGLEQMLGAALMNVVTRTFNGIRGAGADVLPEQTRKVLEIIKRRGLEPLMPQQVYHNQILENMAEQAAATFKGIGEKLNRQTTSAYTELMRLNPEGAASYSMLHDTLAADYETYKNNILSAFPKLFRSKVEQGEAIDKGIDAGLASMKDNVNSQYNIAKGIAEPRLELAVRYHDGGPGESTGKSVFETIDSAFFGKPKRIVPESGPPEITGSGGVDPNTELGKLLTEIRSNYALVGPIPDPRSPGSFETATDQMNDYLSRLWEFTQKPIGVVRTDNEVTQARNVYGAINRMLDGAVADSADPVATAGWRAAWIDARRSAKQYFEIREAAPVIKALKSGDENEVLATLSGYAKSLTSPTGTQYENLRTLMNVMPSKYSNVLREGVLGDLLADGDNLTKNMTKWELNTPLRKLLFDDEDWKVLSMAAPKFEELKKIGIPDLLGQSTSESMSQPFLAKQLLEGGTPAMYAMLQKVAANPASPLGRQVRASIIDQLMDASLTVVRGEPRVSAALLENALKTGELKTYVQRFLSSEDITTVKEVAAYLEYVNGFKISSGASLQGHDITAKVRHLELSALKALSSNRLVGLAVTTPRFHEWMYGRGASGVEKWGDTPLQQFGNLVRLLWEDKQVNDLNERKQGKTVQQQTQEMLSPDSRFSREYADGGIVKAPTSPDAVEQALQKLRDQKDSLQKTINSINNPPQPPVKKADGGLVDGDTEVRRALRNRERDRSLVGKIGPGVPEQYDVDYRTCR